MLHGGVRALHLKSLYNGRFGTRRKFGYIGYLAKWGWGSKMQGRGMAVRAQPSAGLQVLQVIDFAISHFLLCQFLAAVTQRTI